MDKLKSGLVDFARFVFFLPLEFEIKVIDYFSAAIGSLTMDSSASLTAFVSSSVIFSPFKVLVNSVLSKPPVMLGAEGR